MEIVTLNGIKYEKIKTTIGQLEENDLVLGSDQKWHKQVPHDIHKAKRMFRLWFKDRPYKQSFRGQFTESDEGHLWTFVNPQTNIPITLNTEQLYEGNLNLVKDFPVGTLNGLFLSEIEEIEPKDIRSITVSASDSLYEVKLNPGDTGQESWDILTHNCDFRMVCGRLGAVASRMMFDNMQATTIDGQHKGAGMAKSGGQFYTLQIYYEEVDWLIAWYKDRGLNPHGFNDDKEEYDIKHQNNVQVDLGEDEDIELKEEVDEIKFNEEIKSEVDKTKRQKFEEV